MRPAISVQRKATDPDWDPAEHPRDRLGRFIETNAWVRIWGGMTGRVVRNVGGGRIEVDREDGQRVRVHRNYLTVIERPGGGEPTDDPDQAEAAPVQPQSPDAEDVAPDAKPVYSAAQDEDSDPSSPAQEDTMAQPTITGTRNTYGEAEVFVEPYRATDVRGYEVEVDRFTQEGAHTYVYGFKIKRDGTPGGRHMGILLDGPIPANVRAELARMIGEGAGESGGTPPLPDLPPQTQQQAIAEVRRALAANNLRGMPASEVAALPDDLRTAVEDADEVRVRELLRNLRRRGTTEPEPVDASGFVLGGMEPDDDEIDGAVAEQPDGSLTVLDATVADKGVPPEPDAEDGEIVSTEVLYEFPSWRERQALDSINAANRRAERAGIPERFTYTIEHYDKPIGPAYPGGPERYEQRTRLTLNRPTVQREGWKFVATLTWDEEAGLVTRVVPEATLHERPEARKCDVCKASRDRRDTYVVQQADGDRELQVGSNCLQQFLGIAPAGLWMLGFEPEIGGEGGDDDPLGRGGGGNYRQASRDVLAVGLALVTEHGWVSRSRSDERNMATADRLMMLLHDRGPTRPPEAVREWEAYRDKIMGEARAREDEATALLDFARTMEGDSDYAINMRAVATPETVDERNIPLLVSAVAASNARREREARERAARESAQVSQHVGTVGDKITDTPARVVGVRTIEGHYGTTTLFTLVDDQGNIFKWFASGNKTDLASIDDRVTVSGTIKDHGQFRGVNETTLTRARIKPTGEALDRMKAEEAAAKAAAKAERDRIKALRKRLSDPAPEGFTKTTGAQPVGARVRIGPADDGSGYYGYGRVLFEASDGRQMVQIEPYGTDVDWRHKPNEFAYDVSREIAVDRIVATAGAPSEADVNAAAEFIARLRRLPGQEAPVSTYRVEDPEALLRATYPVGSTVRIEQPGTMSPVLHVNVPVVRIEPADPEDRYATPRVVVRMPDGTERSLPPSSIAAYTPA